MFVAVTFYNSITAVSPPPTRQFSSAIAVAVLLVKSYKAHIELSSLYCSGHCQLARGRQSLAQLDHCSCVRVDRYLELV